MSGLVALFVVLLLALQGFAMVSVVRRALWLNRLLRNPQLLRDLLSPETLAALREAGLDPDAPDAARMQKSPELRHLLAADLRRSLGSQVLNPFRRPAPLLAGAAPSAPPAQPNRPRPIDAPSGSGLRVGLALAIFGVAVAALLVLIVRP